MVHLYALILCAGFLDTHTVGARVALDWNRYTTTQLLESKERSKKAGNLDIAQEIEKILTSRGITSTITLAQAPEGQEWVLRNKNMVLEKRTDAPTTPPPGAGAGQWVFVDPNWLYLEKKSGNIVDTDGIRVGKIGDLELNKGGITPPVAQALQEASERETKARQQTENLLAVERIKYTSRVQELERQLAELAKKAGSTTSTNDTTLPPSPSPEPPSTVDVPPAPEAPTAPTAPENTPEAPEAPPAPDAPDAPDAPPFIPEAPSAPDAPDFGNESAGEKTEIGTVLPPLSADELNKLQDAKKQSSDQLFIATLKKITTAFMQNIDDVPYITIIKKELTLLRNNQDFYKRTELINLLEKGVQECFIKKEENPDKLITTSTIAECLKRHCNDCLFNADFADSLAANIQTITETMIMASDELFKNYIKRCTNTFPQTIDNKSYANMIVDAFKKLEQDKNFHKKEGHKFAISALTKELQNMAYDPENPTLYLEQFNNKKEAYFNSWIAECNQCLFDTKDDADMSDNIRWIISFLVAASRAERDIQEFANSISAQKRSDFVIAELFIHSDPNTATVEGTWLPALRDVLTDPSFLKPYGLMLSYGATESFSLKNINKPVMQILRQPVSKTIKDPALAFINSATAYLVFDSDKTKLDFNKFKQSINTILLKPRIEKILIKPTLEIMPETIGSSFAQDAFAHKNLVQVIALIEKIKKRPNALNSALYDMKINPQKLSNSIIEQLGLVGFSETQKADIKTVLMSHENHFKLLEYVSNYIKEYEQEVKKTKNSAYKNGKKLYLFIKETIKDPNLVESFEAIDREADAVYSALSLYFKAIPNTFTKTIPASLFRKTIEPYGILVKTIDAFNTDMTTPEYKNKALSRLINSITALNSGKLSAGTEYPDIITASKDSIENQALYKGKLDDALQALANNKFDEFIQAIDKFVALSGTIATTTDDGSVKRSAPYDLIIKTFQETEGTLLLNDIKHILEAINQASYKLTRFEQDTLENLNALVQLKGKLTPIIKLLGTSLSKLNIDEYKKKYTDMINSDEFLQTAKIEQTTKQNLKKSLLEQLDGLTGRIQILQAKKPSDSGSKS